MALCPAGVDVPGYMALVGEGRCADAVRLIRKDNPMPTACAYICEHPCEARCRRDMIDASLNIRGLKRYAVDNAGDVPQPECAPSTGKTVAVIGGGVGCAIAYPEAKAAHEAGADEIVVKDGHGDASNIDPLKMPEYVTLIRGKSGHPYNMMYGIDDSYDGVLYLSLIHI